jgi:hypothetical protein
MPLPVQAVDPADPALRREIRAMGAGRLSRTQLIVLVVLGFAAVVGFAFFMAMMSQRR